MPQINLYKFKIYICGSIGGIMQQEDNKSLKIQLVHQLIGKQLFDIEGRDNMSEIRSTLTQSTPLALYENYHFEHCGKKVSQYQEVSQVFEAEMQGMGGSFIEVRILMQPFADRSSRYHFAKVKKILQNPVIWAVVTNKDSEDKLIANVALGFGTDQQSEIRHDLETLLEKPLTSPLIQPKTPQRFPEFVKSFNYSGYNPPPYFRKLAGDFYYLHLSTLEGVDYHISANPEGFFLNSSTGSHFNPVPISSGNHKNGCFPSLLDLLMSLSPKFRESFNFAVKGVQVTEIDKMMNSSLFSLFDQQPQGLWTKDSAKQGEIHSWSNQNLMEQNLKQVDPNAIKDWNQLFQMQALLPSDTLIDRLNKEKLKFKLYQELAQFAKSGAVSIVEEKILPMAATTAGGNIYSFPPAKKNVFTLGSLLFTITQESPYTYSQNRKKDTKDAVPTGNQVDNSLKNLALVEKLAIPELHLIHMVVVKYRGFKIVVQSIIPGAVEKKKAKSLEESQSQTQSVPDEIQMDESVKKLCKKLQISQSVTVIGDSKGTGKKIVCSPHLKIIKGSDKRKYLSNLNKLSPKDYNYPGNQNENCVLRPEILQIYKDRQKCSIPINPVLGTSINVEPSEKVKMQEQKLKSIAKFAKEIVVPMFINNICNSMRKYLSDTKGVMFVLHKMGLSSRYLGRIYDQSSEQQHPHLKMVIQRVILVKTLKNIFRLAMRQTDIISLKAILVRMLNCVFGSPEGLKAMQEDENDKNDSEKDGSQQGAGFGSFYKKKKKRANKEKDDTLLEFSIPQRPSKYLNIKPSELWEIVKKVAMIRYSHKLPQKIEEYLGFSIGYKFNKLATLRDLCLNLGLVLEKKQYLSDQWRAFLPNDIVEFKPICKHIPIECNDLLEIIEDGDKMVAKCQVQEAIDSYNKAMQYIMANFGGLHQKLAMVHKKLSNIYFRIGEIDTALLFASHSCYIFESIFGIDHIETIENYTMLAFYHYSKKNFEISEHFMLKSIHLNFTTYGECYPELIVGYLNLSTIYESQKKYADAIVSIVSGLNLAIKIFGPQHIHSAICYSALATLHYEIPDIQQCIKYQTKAVDTLSNILKDDDSRVKQSYAVLEYYKTLQNTKKIKEVHEKEQKKLEKLYSGMQLFKMPEPSMKEKQEFFMRMNKFGKKKFLY